MDSLAKDKEAPLSENHEPLCRCVRFDYFFQLTGE